MRDHYRRRDETDAPFKVAGKGAWVSWVTIAAALSGAFAAGVWATNLQRGQAALAAEVVELHASLDSLRVDVAWLVRHQGGHPDKDVAVDRPVDSRVPATP